MNTTGRPKHARCPEQGLGVWAGEVSQTHPPDNAAGDLLALVDGKGQVTKWNYDEYGRVTNKLDQAGTVILKYTYDADGRLASRWSAAKGTTYYTNDAVRNLTKINYPVSTDVSFAYDALNRVTYMLDAAGTTQNRYAAGGQLWTEDPPPQATARQAARGAVTP